jgi:hypothetical protein
MNPGRSTVSESPTPDRRQGDEHPWQGIQPATPRPELIAWAILVRMHHFVLVVEPAAVHDLPPAVHLALSTDYDRATEVLADNGWRPRSWLPRSWGSYRPDRPRPFMI